MGRAVLAMCAVGLAGGAAAAAALFLKYAIKDRRVRELEDEAMLLQQRTQEAEQELKKATSCHQAQIAKLNAQCSSLLESFNIIRYQHNATVQGLLQRLEETEEWCLDAEKRVLQTMSRLQEERNKRLLQQLKAAGSCDGGSTAASQSSSNGGDGHLQTEDSSVDLTPLSPHTESDWDDELPELLDVCEAVDFQQ